MSKFDVKQQGSEARNAPACCQPQPLIHSFHQGFNPSGRKGPYSTRYPAEACQVQCQVSGTDEYRTPLSELAGTDESAYFPDGVVCHEQGGRKLYCINHMYVRKASDGVLSLLWEKGLI